MSTEVEIQAVLVRQIDKKKYSRNVSTLFTEEDNQLMYDVYYLYFQVAFLAIKTFNFGECNNYC